MAKNFGVTDDGSGGFWVRVHGNAGMVLLSVSKSGRVITASGAAVSDADMKAVLHVLACMGKTALANRVKRQMT
ncbi:hypothetical protein FHR81_002032 [Actinoalloteichus hoggarensis]|uniref:Uncharacterized protein n=1 Tax=Actinoalloteichus hoggarensis TaxID=1470176 RepID=A0A221W5R3_9PSEU|nr:hypothetical protein [Actinoalloteichus hoggarensis]ASO21063.1 hypothetical protein AHOG_17190 [Actinoalloteichus hoggarensis]MBB5920994.1 hypothetical protein [Actinoalloteichus hoggarensis]